MGLVEWEWIITLATLEPKDVEYTDFVASAKTLVTKLQDEVSNYVKPLCVCEWNSAKLQNWGFITLFFHSSTILTNK